MEVWEKLDLWFDETWDKNKVQTVKPKAQVTVTRVEKQVLENPTKQKQAPGGKELRILWFGTKHPKC